MPLHSRIRSGTPILSFIMFAMSCGIYNDFTEVPVWQMDGEGDGLVIDGDDDSDEEREREGGS